MDLKKRKNSYVKNLKNRKNKRKENAKIFASGSKGRMMSFLFRIIGILMAIGGGMSFVIIWVYSAWRSTTYQGTAFLFLCFAVVGIILYVKFRKKSRFLARYRFYMRNLQNRDFITLEELSGITGRKVSFLKQDLKRMLDAKLFLQGHLGQDDSILFLTDEVYQKSREKSVPYEATEDATEDTTENATEVPTDYKELASDSLGFYEQMQKRIQSRAVQRIVTDFGVYTVRILAYEVENEGRERFLLYYLPVTRKLLLSYEEMEKEGIAGEATDVEDVLNTIRYSFEIFAKRLSESRGMDVETDILALDTILSGMQLSC